MTKDDPVVARVRASRRRIFSALDNDPKQIEEWAKRMEAKLGDRVIGYERAVHPARPANPKP